MIFQTTRRRGTQMFPAFEIAQVSTEEIGYG